MSYVYAQLRSTCYYFSLRFNNSNRFQIYGVTCSYSSRPFLCALALVTYVDTLTVSHSPVVPSRYRCGWGHCGWDHCGWDHCGWGAWQWHRSSASPSSPPSSCGPGSEQARVAQGNMYRSHKKQNVVLRTSLVSRPSPLPDLIVCSIQKSTASDQKLEVTRPGNV